MKVVKKQLNSHKCLICGMDNKLGVQAPFYEMEDGTVVTVFKYKEEHQSYPGRTHGGMITCMLDELIGRAIWITEPETWGVTTNINVRFLKPVPYNTELIGIGQITKSNRFLFEAEGYIKDKNNVILAKATATYFKLKEDQIMDNPEHNEMFLVPDDVTEIEI